MSSLSRVQAESQPQTHFGDFSGQEVFLVTMFFCSFSGDQIVVIDILSAQSCWICAKKFKSPFRGFDQVNPLNTALVTRECNPLCKTFKASSSYLIAYRSLNSIIWFQQKLRGKCFPFHFHWLRAPKQIHFKLVVIVTANHIVICPTCCVVLLPRHHEVVSDRRPPAG